MPKREKKGRVIPGPNIDEDETNRNWLREWGRRHGERGQAETGCETAQPESPDSTRSPDR